MLRGTGWLQPYTLSHELSERSADLPTGVLQRQGEQGAAVLDRLLHHAETVTIEGKSYRITIYRNGNQGPQDRIADEVEKAFAQNTQIPWWHQESCFIIQTDFLCSIAIVSDDGFGR